MITLSVAFPAISAAFLGALVEAVEAATIVLAVGAGHGLLEAATLGAVAAWGLIIATAWAVRHPLAKLPENALKFAVGILLSAFGVFWTGEGLGVAWPGGDLAILGIAALFLLVALVTVEFVRRPGMY
jgi:Ca2+/H+ antiporter, TMEM165/GDT1 family